MGLHNGHSVIHVNDQPGKTITFGMNEAVAISVSVGQVWTGAQGIGSLDFIHPKILSRVFAFERKDANSDTSFLIMTEGKRLVFIAFYFYPIAIFQISFNRLNGSWKYPRMKTLNWKFTTVLQKNYSLYIHPLNIAINFAKIGSWQKPISFNTCATELMK